LKRTTNSPVVEYSENTEVHAVQAAVNRIKSA